jgi:hypothetical protein
MSLMIRSWFPPGVCGTPATGSPCDPCRPPPPPSGGGPGTGLPLFTDATVTINQAQYFQKSVSGQVTLSVVGSIIIWMAKDNIPVQGAFGVPGIIGPLSYGFSNTWVVYKSFITITHPYYPSGSYNQNLPDIAGGTIGYATGDPVTDGANSKAFASANAAAGNAAIAQANTILGNP